MSTYTSEGSEKTQNSQQQPTYPQRYQNSNNPQFDNSNVNAQQQARVYPSYPQQYPPQYPPQQQQYYQQTNPYQNYPPQQYAPQYQQPNQQIPQQPFNPETAPPSPIPPSSPLLRHGLSQIIGFIKKNREQFSEDFNKKFDDNEDFRSLNRKVVFIPSMMIISHVIMNRKKKWFRLTVNAPMIRYSLLGLFMLHISSNILYVAAYRDLLSRNRDKIQKMIVREEFLGSGHK